MSILQPYWSPSCPTTPLLLPSYTSPYSSTSPIASPYTEFTSVHPAEITPMPATYLLPVSEYQVGIVDVSIKYKPYLPNCQNSTTEDITFAEAFTALANYDPPHPDNYEGTHEQREQEKTQYSNQHIETFNEISLGRI